MSSPSRSVASPHEAVARLGFDVFLSHSHEDRTWVEGIARRLEDERGIHVWLDKWILVPGGRWQQAMGRALSGAHSCAVFIGGRTPTGWFSDEVQRALNLQVQDEKFRVIPVLLPDCPNDTSTVIPEFLELRTWADFREGQDVEYAFHVLVQGVRGESIGRWKGAPYTTVTTEGSDDIEVRLAEWRRIKEAGGLHETVVIEIERKLLGPWLEGHRRHS